MSQQPMELQLPPGPLRDAFMALNLLFVKTRRHGAALKDLLRLFMASLVAASHQGFALLGPSGSGKSTTGRQFEMTLREQLGLAQDAPSPLATVTMHGDMTPRGLIEALLSAYGDPLSTAGNRTVLKNRLLKLSQQRSDIKGILLDEVQHAFVGRSGNQRVLMMTALKDLVSEYRRPIIAMGPLEVEGYLEQDTHISRRFAERAFLEDLKLDLADDIHDIRLVLSAMEKLLPREPDCKLDSPDMLLRLYVACNGSFGTMVDLVRLTCRNGAADQLPMVNLRQYSVAWRSVAPRKKRHDQHDPFLLDMATVKALAAQLSTKLRPTE